MHSSIYIIKQEHLADIKLHGSMTKYKSLIGQKIETTLKMSAWTWFSRTFKREQDAITFLNQYYLDIGHEP